MWEARRRYGAHLTAAKVESRLPTAGVAFAAATALVALPVYTRIETVAGPTELLRLLAYLQVLPAVLFFLLIEVVSRRSVRAGEVVAAGLAVASATSILRLVQIASERDIGFGMPLPPAIFKGSIALGALVVGLLLVTLARRLVSRLFTLVAPIFLLTTVVFVGTVTLRADTPNPPASALPPARDTVILLVFDELGRDVLVRDGAIDRRMFPNLRALADEGIWVTDGTTNYGDTCQAVPALLTGRYVDDEACRDFVVRDSDGSIMRDLSSRYLVSVYGEYFRDCTRADADLCHGPSALSARYPLQVLVQHYLPLSIREGPLATIFGRVHPFTRELWAEFISDLDTVKARGRAYFVHVMLPHSPFALDEKGQLHHSPWQYFYLGPDSDPRVYENYRRQVRFVDAMVGEMIEKLRKEDLYATSTIVVTGDHGPRALHSVAGVLEGRAAEAPNIPVIIRSPGLPPAKVASGYEHIDLAPTLREMLGLPPTEADGHSIFSMDRPKRQRTFRWERRTYVLGDVWRLAR